MNKRSLYTIALLSFILTCNFIYGSGITTLPGLIKTGDYPCSFAKQNQLNACSCSSLTSALDLEDDLDKKDLMAGIIHFPYTSYYIPGHQPAAYSGIFISVVSPVTKQYILTFILRI